MGTRQGENGQAIPGVSGSGVVETALDSATGQAEKTRDSSVGPGEAIGWSLATAKYLSTELGGGYLFRATVGDDSVFPEQPSTATMNNSSRRHLRKLGVDQGETCHGCRAACAIAVRMAGASDSASVSSFHYGLDSINGEQSHMQEPEKRGIGTSATPKKQGGTDPAVEAGGFMGSTDFHKLVVEGRALFAYVTPDTGPAGNDFMTMHGIKMEDLPALVAGFDDAVTTIKTTEDGGSSKTDKIANPLQKLTVGQAGKKKGWKQSAPPFYWSRVSKAFDTLKKC
ncbi:hypothetical protein Bbelb_349520 [Branchiostoma belcheri]|nr:hypothetical protein Bbelb_349520 [Branchiostoma belcheri]